MHTDGAQALICLYLIIVAWCHTRGLSSAEDAEEELGWKGHISVGVMALLWPVSLLIFLLISSDGDGPGGD